MDMCAAQAESFDAQDQEMQDRFISCSQAEPVTLADIPGECAMCHEGCSERSGALAWLGHVQVCIRATAGQRIISYRKAPVHIPLV